MQNTPKRPYLLRAYFDWIIDNDFTPYLVVDANYPNVKVPEDYIQNGRIVLNLSPSATANLSLGKSFIEFNARFQGMLEHISIPLGAAIAIYAHENSEGVAFEKEDIYDIEHFHMDELSVQIENNEHEKQNKPKKINTKHSHLKIIK